MKGKADFKILISFILCAYLLCILTACTSQKKAVKPIVLTEEQKQVMIVQSCPAINKKLRKHCKVVGVLDSANMNTIRIVTVNQGGNYAEVVETGNHKFINYKSSYGNNYYQGKTHVRRNYTYSSAILYKCPCGFDDNN